MNNWNIPSWLEVEVRKRDTHCIYCGTKFNRSIKKYLATWEHIINDAKIVNRENIALCCCSCNASKGAKELSDWLASDYCKRKNITVKNVAPIVKQFLGSSTPPVLP
ncbi:MAG: HNH endonuclease [Candidatus Magasanikbacteria bacterium]|nr:HNH endonuclease [Candidatus Magasanikbacteria bacterium]